MCKSILSSIPASVQVRFFIYTDWFRLYCRCWRLMFAMRSKALRYHVTLHLLWHVLAHRPVRIDHG